MSRQSSRLAACATTLTRQVRGSYFIFAASVFTTVIAAHTIAAPARAATPLVDLVDADASFVLLVRDTPAVLKKWNATPWAKTWNDPQIKKYLAPLREKVGFDERDEKLRSLIGVTTDELLALIEGDFLFTLGAPAQLLSAVESNDNENLPLLIAADIGENKTKIETLIAAASEKDSTIRTRIETYADETIHIVENAAPLPAKKSGAYLARVVWAVAEGKFFFSPSQKSIIRAIDALKKGSAPNALGKSIPYLRMMNQTGDPQVLLALNFQALYPRINSLLSRNANPAVPAAIDYANLAATLGLDSINDIYLGVTLASDRCTITGAVLHTGRDGLPKLLSLGTSPIKIPDFASAAWPSISVMRYDIPAAYTTIEDIFSAALPAVSIFLQNQIQQSNETLGIDFKRDIIGNLGDQIVTAVILPAGVTLNDANLTQKSSALYALQLKDPRTFERTLAALRRSFGLENSARFSTRDYLGATIYSFDISERGVRNFITYAIVKNQFLLGIGASDTTETAVQNLLNGAVAPMENRADIREIFSTIPSAATLFYTQDMRLTMLLVSEKLQTHPLARNLVDIRAKPDAALLEKYWATVYAWTTAKSDGLTFTWKLLYAK